MLLKMHFPTQPLLFRIKLLTFVKGRMNTGGTLRELVFALILISYFINTGGQIDTGKDETNVTTMASFLADQSSLPENIHLKKPSDAESSCQDTSIKNNKGKVCVSAGLKCIQKTGNSCCSAKCQQGTEHGNAADRKFSCTCALSDERERCNTSADCSSADCSEKKKEKPCCKSRRNRCHCTNRKCE